MILFAFAALIMLMLAITTLIRASRRAADGYEDEVRFHHGICPRPTRMTKDITHIAVATPPTSRRKHLERRRKQLQSVYNNPL